MSTQSDFSLEIRYCLSWNYKPKAASLAEKLQDEYECNVTLVPGDRGEFSIWFYEQIESDINDRKTQIHETIENKGLFVIGKKEYDFPTFHQVISSIDKILHSFS